MKLELAETIKNNVELYKYTQSIGEFSVVEFVNLFLNVRNSGETECL